jgi:translation initiation factor IF-2
MSLLEHNVFLEGLGGEVPYVGVSSKTGVGIPELLDLIVLAAELEGLTANPELPGTGLVIEAHVDPKRGNTATLIVRDGSVTSGEYLVCGEALAPVRIMENFLGKNIKEALPGSPIRIVGFSALPEVGAPWTTIETKKQAEEDAAQARAARLAGAKATSPAQSEEEGTRTILPLVIKTDFAGTGDAVLHELAKVPQDARLEVRVVGRSAGSITEGDVRLAGAGTPPGIVVGFNVKVEREARDLAERLGVVVATFDIIYELTDWLTHEVTKRRPRENSDERIGLAKILKVFSMQQGKVVLGGRVEEGTLIDGKEVKLMRRQPAPAGDLELGRGEILSLQVQKAPAKKVETRAEFGAMVRLSAEPAPGDYLEAFETILK